jgi:polysaccharide export outer membrane protein
MAGTVPFMQPDGCLPGRRSETAFRLASPGGWYIHAPMKNKMFAVLLIALASLISPAFAQIEAGQSVKIKIMGVPAEEKAKIDETYPVSKNGMVNMPFIGEIRAAGLESDELAMAIEKAYREGEIYPDPTIAVVANEIEGDPLAQAVHIGGSVRAPGPRPYAKGLTVFQAVQAAGGPNEFGAMNRVVLLRGGKEMIIDLEDLAGKKMITVPNDTIEVPKKNWRGR